LIKTEIRVERPYHDDVSNQTVSANDDVQSYYAFEMRAPGVCGVFRVDTFDRYWSGNAVADFEYPLRADDRDAADDDDRQLKRFDTGLHTSEIGPSAIQRLALRLVNSIHEKAFVTLVTFVTSWFLSLHSE
jgi:hypothetical protein